MKYQCHTYDIITVICVTTNNLGLCPTVTSKLNSPSLETLQKVAEFSLWLMAFNASKLFNASNSFSFNLILCISPPFPT